VRIRSESPRDRHAVRDLLSRAFPTDAEARIVDAVRGRSAPQVSLVAESSACEVIGHILFTPVEIRSGSGVAKAMGLGPMAVLPGAQRQGVGSALVSEGLSACRAAGEHVVLVLGHPDYYPRFGFLPAWNSGLYYATPGPNPAFMVCELVPGVLRGMRGEVVYPEAFGRHEASVE
jgi:putative acetyltransferase